MYSWSGIDQNTRSKNRCLHHLEAHLRQAEGSRAKRARERSEQHMTRSVFVSEWTHPKALSVFNPECMIAWSTMGPTSKQNEDNGVLDTLKRHLWTNRLEGWRKNIHPWADITRSTCNAGLCTAEADNANNQWKGEGMNFKLKRNFAKDQRSDGTKTKFLKRKHHL